MKQSIFSLVFTAAFFYVGQLNAVCFDFETGDLQGWKVVSGQFGKIVTDREFEHHSKYAKYTKSLYISVKGQIAPFKNQQRI